MSGILCEHCTATCCRYIALPLDKPRTPADFDDLRWFLVHEGVSVFVEDGDWYINIKNKCRHLADDDYQCTIYDKRPKICRKYKYKDCDYVEGEYDYELHFTDDKQMAEYIRIKFDNNKIEKPKRAGLRSGRKNRSRIRSISAGGSAKDRECLVTRG